jgi:hypothetical protein
MDWKYALSLELTDPGFDFTLLHDFRQRLLAHEAGQRFLDTFLATCKARGWLKARGTQRTDATHVLTAIRTLHRLECVLEAMHWALNQLSDGVPTWVQQHVPPARYTRDGLRSDQARLPKDASKREALVRQVGADGYQLLEWVRTADPSLGLRELPALETRRRIWLQQYYRCTVPGLEALRWRMGDEQPPAAVRIALPYDLEARYSSKRETHWVGYKLHLTETCDVSGDPVMRIRFDGATCRACPACRACTSAQDAPRQLTVRLQVYHEALQAARHRQETTEFKAQYTLRAGVESSLSQGVRCFDLRRSRYLGLARTHLQQLLTGTAMNVVRVIVWLWGEPLGERQRKPGHFAQLAPHPLSRQTVLCYMNSY